MSANMVPAHFAGRICIVVYAFVCQSLCLCLSTSVSVYP
jgi:hypothetical protein